MGKKRLKGVPILHNEVKQTHGLKLTDTSWESAKAAADSLGISRSELIERLLRKGEAWLIDVGKHTAEYRNPES